MKPQFYLLFILLSLFSCSTALEKKNQNYDYGTDFHMHIHTPPKEYDDMEFNGGRALLAADSIGLKRAFFLSSAYSVNASWEYAKTENNFVIDEAKKYPGKAVPLCAVNPKYTWALKEIIRCRDLGGKVLKIHLMASGIDLKKEADYKLAQDFFEQASKLGFTLLVHASYPSQSRGNEASLLLKLMNEFPKTPFIIGHLFGKNYALLNELKVEKFWVEISAVPVMLKDESVKTEIVSMIRKVGLSHFIFGSDWPVFHPAETLKGLRSFPFTEGEFQAIVYKNAEALNYLF